MLKKHDREKLRRRLNEEKNIRKSAEII